jgi:MFS family permease
VVTTSDEQDPRRWITLAIVITSILIVVLDNSVLNVAIPTILRDFHTTLPSLEWVVTGYALTFATLLIIGGRLGDIYGHRRVFIVGAALFGCGSLLASLSWNVPSLILGEAIIEGVGASLMMPATLAILSTTFHGRERAVAFSAWGATAGAASAFGPVVGGFLTTDYSWRWSFRINVIIAPLAIIGALLVMRRGTRGTGSRRIDGTGAAMVAPGMFLLVFALSEGGSYGWVKPIGHFSIAGWRCWPSGLPISVIPVIALLAVADLAAFYHYELWLERHHREPLFEFGQLQHKTFRYGLLTTMVLAMGQLGLLFALPILLQDGRHLSALTNGLWLLPIGVFIVAGSQVGARLTRRFGTTRVVRAGLVFETVGLALVAAVVSDHVRFWSLVGGFVIFGIGVGFASSQLTNVVLSEITKDKSGVASGANTTVRQTGSALGIAVIGSVLTAQTVRRATGSVRSSSLPAAVKAQAIVSLRALGANYSPAPGLPSRQFAVLAHTLAGAVAGGTQPALLFAAGVVGCGAVLSLLIPPVELGDDAVITVEAFEDAFAPLDIDPSIVVEAP